MNLWKNAPLFDEFTTMSVNLDKSEAMELYNWMKLK